MTKKINAKSQQQGFILKYALPIVIIFGVVGFLYWSTSSGSTSENAVAKGVAKFYAEVRQAVKPGGSRLDDYTIELPPSEQSVNNQLKERAKTVRPAKKSWAGDTKKRSFKENDTIKTALQNYGRAEGIEVIWDLKYDYIIKNHFAEQGNLKALVNKVSRTVGNDYGGTVHSYFCPKERAMVITAEPDSYIKSACVTTMSAAQLKRQKALEKEYQLERQNNGY